MSVYEHLMTLGSFILALGIGTILSFAAALYHRRHEVRLAVTHMLWLLIVFFGQISFWLGSYIFSATPKSSIPAIAFIVVQPVLLFLQSALVTPDLREGLDLRAYHETDGRGYISLFILANVTQIAFMVRIDLLNPQLQMAPYLVVLSVGLPLAAAAILFRRRWVQLVSASALLVHQIVEMVFSAIPLTL